MKDEALVVSSFFCGEGGWGREWEVLLARGWSERPLPRIAPLKNFQKNFFGSGYGVVLNGWGELVIRGTERQPQRGGVGRGSGGIYGRCCFGGDMMYLHILHDVIM